jgi:predicted HAD superfamily phosphohydrolase YqeG
MPESFDFISATDRPALVACSRPAWTDTAKKVLQELGYKVHTVVAHEEFNTRFSQITYQVVIMDELFAANKPEENLSLRAMQQMPMSQRRHVTLVLLGDNFQTLDSLQAFQQSVHVVINGAEIIMLKPLIEKAVADNDLFLHTFREVQNRVARS